MKILDLIPLVSAHTGNPATENVITIWDWVIGLPLRIIFIVGAIFLIKYGIKKWKKRK